MATDGDNTDSESQVCASTATLRLFQREPHFMASLTLNQGASGPVKVSHSVFFSPFKCMIIKTENDLKTFWGLVICEAAITMKQLL